MVDDYTNVHTKHRPKDLNPNQISKKATLLLKRFDHAAIPVTNLPESNNPVGVDPTLLEYFVKDHLSSLMKTYAQVMPNWIRAKFFDPKCERKRLMAHNYQEQEQIRVMRSMVDCQLIDCIELPLKSFDNFYTAIQHALQLGLSEYQEKFLVIKTGDWPAQFYIRQIVYNPPPNAEYFLKNIISMIGALHVSLNGRENPVLQFIIFFKKLYLGVFGQNRKPLANKPQPWRITLVADITYGGWTLIRRSAMQVFAESKDVQYLTLVNLLDNYLPIVLSIYSITFKCNNLDLYIYGMLRIWIMFFCFRRRHYNKAPLVWLSNVLYWNDTDHPLYHLLRECLQVLDEYPVENFHSTLRGQTNDYNTPDEIGRKARKINVNTNM